MVAGPAAHFCTLLYTCTNTDSDKEISSPECTGNLTQPLGRSNSDTLQSITVRTGPDALSMALSIGKSQPKTREKRDVATA